MYFKVAKIYFLKLKNINLMFCTKIYIIINLAQNIKLKYIVKKYWCKTQNIITNKCNKYFVLDVEMDFVVYRRDM